MAHLSLDGDTSNVYLLTCTSFYFKFFSHNKKFSILLITYILVYYIKLVGAHIEPDMNFFSVILYVMYEM